MSNIPVALELYSVRQDLARDPAGTLKAVAEMGYTGVEFAGAPVLPAAEVRAMLDDVGLVCCGWHTPFAMVEDDRLAETVAYNQTVGNPYVIVPGIPAELRKTREDWLRLAKFFNKLAGKLAAYRMQTGYHNHHVEFTPLDGEWPWHTFFRNTDRSVIMQIDTGNALNGGAETVPLLKEYPGRSQTIHLKPFDAAKATGDFRDGFRTMIGEDGTPWQEIFELCETIADTKWYIVEYETDLYPPLEGVERCLRALQALGVGA
jgi:sugar phosphate isomerase/epimerase